VVDTEPELASCYQNLINIKGISEIYFYNKNPEFLLNGFKSIFNVVEAAGGIVKNPAGEYLFIFRNGKWDLPKGKIEKGETIEDAAVREVEEECGIKGLTISKPVETTYHTYVRDDREVFKPTYWFEMTSSDTSALVPQEDEGITEVRWISVKDLDMVKNNTYPSIQDILLSLN
jgi:8-oxo-dGTP pyrophosphatase MutT (NUDIX family)